MNRRLDEGLADFLREIRQSLPEKKIYLVGGAVRDLLLGKAVKDLDFVVASGSVDLAKAVKKHFHGVWYTLDDDHQTARVILEQGGANEIILDFTSFIGATLEEDLCQRDFTINAMAIDLDDPEKLIDPLGGREDLQKKRLKLASSMSMESDPLRVIRAVRMIRTHNLEVDGQIAAALRVATTKLDRISGERIRDELIKCFEIPDLSSTYNLLEGFGIYGYLFWRINDFENSFAGRKPAAEEAFANASVSQRHDADVVLNDRFLKCRREIIDSLDKVLTAKSSENLPEDIMGAVESSVDLADISVGLKELLTEEIQGGRNRIHLIILIGFFSPSLGEAGFGERLGNFLMLGQKEVKAIDKISAGYRNIESLSSKSEQKKLDYYRIFRESGSYALESALLHICNKNPLNPNLIPTSRNTILTWFREQTQTVNPPRLIDGDQLQRELGIRPGPELGEYLEAVREAQVTGEVETYQDAIRFVKQLKAQ